MSRLVSPIMYASRIMLMAYSMLVAKNVILAGVKSVTVFDPEPVEVQDLSSQVNYRILSAQ